AALGPVAVGPTPLGDDRLQGRDVAVVGGGAVDQDVVVGAAGQRVAAEPADEQVAAVPSRKRILPVAADENVIPRQADEGVVHPVADEHVVAAAADHVFDPGDAAGHAAGGPGRQVDHDVFTGDVVDEGVGVGAAVDRQPRVNDAQVARAAADADGVV